MPAVSVIMPVYNREALVKEAIESILSQTYIDFEFIILNDGSTDNTKDIVSNYSDNRIKIIHLPCNCGIATARNIGLKYSTGKYIAVMDSDDICLPTRLERQVEYLEENPDVHILGTHGIKRSNNKERPFQHFTQDAIIKAQLLTMGATALFHPSTMMRTDFLQDNNLLYPNKTTDEDQALWIEAVSAGAKFSILPEKLLIYRRHDGNITSQKNKEMVIQHEEGKTPLREKLLSMYYPELTYSEVQSIAKVMKKGYSLSPREAYKAIFAYEKSLRFPQSIYGESKEMVSNILKAHIDNLIRALNNTLKK
ncbi:glycosyltransferase family 2 protein [Pseudoalteromonas sp.]|uniref:glycosyltransferase family 2 protein n=1 Tax=Pseudoalteromonas sp. TaxID=53249 RepID=UPI00261C85DE|nr:glycosyltransferase family 2 protein [Pseudoalteromonas sp.]MCP4588744.1 glycosyltransferase family 2 protein [Pseudoalteromonas sp.]